MNNELEAMRKALIASGSVPAAPIIPATHVSPAASAVVVSPPTAADMKAAWAAAWAPSGYEYCEEGTTCATKPVPSHLTPSLVLTTLIKCKIPAVSVVSTTVGPQVTTYTVELEDGASVSALKSKEGNVANWFGIQNIRLLTYMEGHPGCFGLVVPNKESGVVAYRDVLSAALSDLPNKNKYIPVALGVETNGRPHVLPLGSSANPHLLIAGKSGSGKSVAIWSVLASIAAMYSPDEVSVYIVDPKQMGYTKWAAMPHLATPVITETTDVVAMLAMLASKDDPRGRSVLDYRTRQLGEFLVDDLAEYNAAVPACNRLPRIVVVIDEYADLMTGTGRSKPGVPTSAQMVTELIDRIARLGRSVGIHLVLATQRPTADTMLPSIKAQTTKIGCQMESPIDSRVVFGEGTTEGAEKLLGAGDAFVKGNNGLTRVKCALVTAKDIKELIRDDILAAALKTVG